jgi:hypothetical protein
MIPPDPVVALFEPIRASTTTTTTTTLRATTSYPTTVSQVGQSEGTGYVWLAAGLVVVVAAVAVAAYYILRDRRRKGGR